MTFFSIDNENMSLSLFLPYGNYGRNYKGDCIILSKLKQAKTL